LSKQKERLNPKFEKLFDLSVMQYNILAHAYTIQRHRIRNYPAEKDNASL